MKQSSSTNALMMRTAWFQKLSMAILAALPLLAWYKIPFPVSLGYALVLFLGIYSIVKARFKINVVPPVFWIVFVYICFMWMYNYDFEAWTLMPPGGWVFFMFFLALIWGIKSFNIVLLKKYMRYVVLISGILFWIQVICVITTGSAKFCFVPNLTGEFTYQDFTYADIVNKQLDGGNPSSVFLEKSYLAYYFLTYLSLIWYDIKEKSLILTKEILFVVATLIASRSGTALVGLTILFVIKLFVVYWNANILRRMILIFLTVPMIVGVIYLYVNSELGQQMLLRSGELSDEHTSGFVRVVGGYMMFDQLNPIEKIIGIPDARERFGIERVDGSLSFYVNGVQMILPSLGYIGLFLYLFFYIRIFRSVRADSKMSIIVLLIMGLLESNYLNPYMMLLTIIPCADYYINKQKKIRSNENSILF